MTKILGLDLGTTSIGWTLIEEGKQIIDIGVRIFPEGVVRDPKTGKEKSKNEERRIKRQTRKMYERRRNRRIQVARLLMSKGMFPQVEQLHKHLQEVELQEPLKSFMQINPYICRHRASLGEKLSLPELGRIFYQMAIRRGYNDLALTDDKDEGKIYEGNPEEGKIGINQTKLGVEKSGTLGSYLSSLDTRVERIRNRYTTRRMYVDEFNLVWEKQAIYHKDVLTDEFRSLLGDPKKGLLFFQRPLKSQKGLIGSCTLEHGDRILLPVEQRTLNHKYAFVKRGKPRISTSHPLFEEFRSRQFINSIRNGDEPLSTEQKEFALDYVFYEKEKFSFEELRKKLKLTSPLDNFNYPNDHPIVGTTTISRLRKIFGKKIWNQMSAADQDLIWQTLSFASDKEWLRKKAETWNLDEKGIKDLQTLKTRMAKSMSSLSAKAIKNILPFLREPHGLIYSEAVVLGGIKNAFGQHAWEILGEDQQTQVIDTAIDIIRNPAAGRDIDTLKNYLRDSYGLSDAQLNKLYHHSDLRQSGDAPQLSDPEAIKNPVVGQTLHQLRKLVNLIIDKHGKPEVIRVELSRDLNASKKQREEALIEQRKNERENDVIKEELDKLQKPHSTTNIRKLKLYREMDRRSGKPCCPYSGRTINISNLFDGEVEIEHIVPYSRSLNNSLSNLTLAYSDANREKSNKTPFEYYEGTLDTWKAIKDRAYSLLPYQKYKRFSATHQDDFDGFASRQLNDTRYISREARSYLEQICKDVSVAQGSTTALLRHWWGLDNILNKTYKVTGFADGEYWAAVEGDTFLELRKWNKESIKKDTEELKKLGYKKGDFLHGKIRKGVFYPYKSRDDHRHHAVDALAVACCKRSYLQEISRMHAQGDDYKDLQEKINFPQPWNSFWQDCKNKIETILVSQKQNKKTLTISTTKQKIKGRDVVGKGIAARGQLHDATVSGRYLDKTGKPYYHTRKSLETITTKTQIDKIVDRSIQVLLLETVRKLFPDVDTSSDFKIPLGAFFRKNDDGTKTPLVFLPNKNGEPIPIKSVRLREASTKAVQLKSNINQWVEPGNNHHVMLYEDEQGVLKEQVVTFWEVVERKKNKLPIYALPKNGKKVITTLQENDYFLLGLEEQSLALVRKEDAMQHLYRVQKISSNDYNFRLHLASTLQKDLELLRIRSCNAFAKMNPIKVHLDAMGQIHKL